MVSEHLSTIVRLRGLLDLTRLVRREDDLSTVLAEIAATVSESLGWGTAVISVYRPSFDDFRVEVVHGDAAARESLLGKTRTWETYETLLDPRFERRGAYLIRHGEFDWVAHGMALYVPQNPPREDPDAWHPEDALFAPLRNSQGALLGVISLDDPVSGRLPSDAELDALVAVASHASLAVESARAAAEAERHRRALEQLLRVSSKLQGGAGEGLLETVCEAIRDALGFGKTSVHLFDEQTGLFQPAASAGWDVNDERLRTALSFDDVQSLLAPDFDHEGCFLLPRAEAEARLPHGSRTYDSSRNGEGALAWHNHWLLVPLYGPEGVRGFAWADDPDDCLIPSRERLQALRLFANQATTALESAEQLQAMRESEARKSAILESALDCVITIDQAGKIIEFNPEAEETFGWTSDEAIGRELAELIVSPTRRDDRRLADYLSTGMAAIVGTRLEVAAIRSNGRTFPVELVVSKVRIPGAPLYTATIRDISRRRRAEDRLREAEAKYRTLVEQLPLVTYVNALGPVIRTEYMSPQVEAMFGYPRDEWLTDDFFRGILHPDDRDRVLAETQQTHATGEPFRSEYRLIAADGRTVWVLDETRAVNDEDGTPLFLQGFILDVTERRATEEARRQSEELYRLVVENSTDLISLVDLQGRLLYVSPSTRRLLGHEPDELVGTSFPELVHPEDLPAVGEHMAATVRGELVSPTTARLRRKDGDWMHIEGTASMILDEFGRPKMVLAVGRDVTERDRLENQLRQTQKMEAIGRLAGGIAHDFNNLLTAILGYSEFIGSDETAGEPARRSAAQITRAAERAGGLTRQLLAFSRKQLLQPRVLDLNEVVTDVEKMLGRVIGEHISLETSLEPAAGHVKADPGQIEQVILNLAVNARDAMPKGGTLSIETASVELDELYTRQHVGLEPGRYVLLAVSDTGEGIDPEVRHRVFEPFFTTKPQGQGTGLGLSTVYGIIAQSDGHVAVYSEPGHGATFKIYLPLVTDAGEARPVPLPSDASATGNETILLVEDEDVVRGIATEILERQGYTVLAAATGEDAVELAERHEGSIQLLLTDVVMPKMDGRELATRVAALRPGIKVLYTSGYTDAAVVHHGVLDDGKAFLQKPFTRKVLTRRVRELLDDTPTPDAADAVAG